MNANIPVIVRSTFSDAFCIANFGITSFSSYINLDVKTNTKTRNWGNSFLQLDFGNNLISYNKGLKCTD